MTIDRTYWYVYDQWSTNDNGTPRFCEFIHELYSTEAEAQAICDQRTITAGVNRSIRSHWRIEEITLQFVEPDGD